LLSDYRQWKMLSEWDIGNSANQLENEVGVHGYTYSSDQASGGPVCAAQLPVVYTRMIEMCVWAYESRLKWWLAIGQAM
jgi:hypothetical protein